MQLTKRVTIAVHNWEENIVIPFRNSGTIHLNYISKDLNRGWTKIEYIINLFFTEDIHLCELEFTLSMLLIIVILSAAPRIITVSLLNIYLL